MTNEGVSGDKCMHILNPTITAHCTLLSLTEAPSQPLTRIRTPHRAANSRNVLQTDKLQTALDMSMEYTGVYN